MNEKELKAAIKKLRKENQEIHNENEGLRKDNDKLKKELGKIKEKFDKMELGELEKEFIKLDTNKRIDILIKWFGIRGLFNILIKDYKGIEYLRECLIKEIKIK